MAGKTEMRAARPKPRAELRAAPTWYEKTHPVGSAERFLDEAAKEALVAAAAGGIVTPRQAVVNATKAVAKKAGEYPDPLLAEAAKLPKGELMRRAGRAEAYRQAMKAQEQVNRAVAATLSPVGNLATTAAVSDLVLLGSDIEQPAIEPEPPDAVVQQDAKGGETRKVHAADEGGEASASATPAPAPGGPRIVINPQVFEDKRDALCVAFNEAFRVVMEDNGFEPVSEPTDKQRKFFADTAYANDELQLRRTILARIATLDTSVSDPTDEQLEETAEMLEMVLEVGAPQNEWEQRAVQRLHDVVSAAAKNGKRENAIDREPPDML